MHSIDSHRPLILVVDDAPDSIEPIVNCLHKADFRTRIATRGERALQLAGLGFTLDLRNRLAREHPLKNGSSGCTRHYKSPLRACTAHGLIRSRNIWNRSPTDRKQIPRAIEWP